MSIRIEGEIPKFNDPTAVFSNRDEKRLERKIPNPFIRPREESVPVDVTPPQPTIIDPEEIRGFIGVHDFSKEKASILELYLQGIRPIEIANRLEIEKAKVLQSISSARIAIGVPRKIPQQEAIRVVNSLIQNDEHKISAENTPINIKMRTVLILYTSGASVDDIAHKAGLSKGSVYTYVGKVKRLLNVPKRMQKDEAIEYIKKMLVENPDLLT